MECWTGPCATVKKKGPLNFIFSNGDNFFNSIFKNLTLQDAQGSVVRIKFYKSELICKFQLTFQLKLNLGTDTQFHDSVPNFTHLLMYYNQTEDETKD